MDGFKFMLFMQDGHFKGVYNRAREEGYTHGKAVSIAYEKGKDRLNKEEK